MVRKTAVVGANYVPADAISQLEMWQADTFNPHEIDKELGSEHWDEYHASLLHDLLAGGSSRFSAQD